MTARHLRPRAIRGIAHRLSLACLLSLAVLLSRGRLALAQEEPATALRIKGSNTLGQLLAEPLAQAYARRHAGAAVEWEALGSSTAFVGLLDGSADLGASSRPIEPEELADARRLGIPLSEYVIGYDAIAVIVHASNPVDVLSIEQMADLFTGRAANWQGLGGRNLPPYSLSLPPYSGTYSLFRQLVLRRATGDPDPFSESTQFVESSRRLVDLVKRDRRAIAYVGVGFTSDPGVRVVSIAGEPDSGQPPMAPSESGIRSGVYPLSRPLFLYTRGEPSGAAREFLNFVLSAEGQQLIASAGLVPRDPAGTALEAERGGALAQAQVAKTPTRIGFLQRSVQLGSADRTLLDGFVEPLQQSSQVLLITGHADSVYPREGNQRYALERAQAVADYLTSKGVPAERLEVRGRAEVEPLASNESEDGRKLNRRVELRLVSGPARAAEPPAVGGTSQGARDTAVAARP